MLGIRLLKTDGSKVELDRKPLSLPDIRKAIGGYYEEIQIPCYPKKPLKPGMQILFVDDEGLIKNKPFNLNASHLARCNIVGDALLVEFEESDLC